MKLSPHFSEDEFRCKCCQGLPATGMAPELIEALEDLRTILGNQPLTIVSGYRCPKYNKKVGGAKTSQHMLGRAADVVHDDREPYEVADAAESVPHFHRGGVGRYDHFTHCDVRGNYGGRCARWDKRRR